MDSSFIRAADPRLIRRVDINRCDGGGEQRGAIDGAESHRPKWDQINHDWTASDRARRVSQDHRLQRLLVAEVKQSGCVTAAGYHAIFRNFIYSDAVEKNMNQDPCHGGGGGRARSDSSASKFGGLMISGMAAPAAVSAHAHHWGDPPKRKDDNNKSSLFSSLFSGMTASTVSAGMTESNLSCSLTAFRRRSTENSSRSVMRRRNSSNLSTLDDGPRTTSNLAPRRASGDGPAPVDFEAPPETRPKEESQQTKEESQREYERPSRPRLKFNEVDFDPKCAATNGESNGRKADPKTEDAVNNETSRNDAEDAEDLIHYLLNVNETRPRSPGPKRREDDDDDDDDAAAAAAAADDADEEDCSSLSFASDSSSDCGWLPWPEDSADDSTSSIGDSHGNDYEGCSNCSKSCYKREEGASFLPWPVTPIGDELLAATLPAKNELARAA